MLLKTILFLLAIYLFVGIFRHFFEAKNQTKSSKPEAKKQFKKDIGKMLEAEDVPFQEIENKTNEK